MKMEPTVCLETSVTNYQCTIYKTPEELRSHVHRGGSLTFPLHSSEWVFLFSWKAANFLKSVVLFGGVASFVVRHENCLILAHVNFARDIRVIHHVAYLFRGIAYMFGVRMLKLLGICMEAIPVYLLLNKPRGELSYLAPLSIENISAPYFKQCFFGWGYYPPDWVKHHASQSQDRNNKYFILYIEFCINNKI